MRGSRWQGAGTAISLTVIEDPDPENPEAPRASAQQDPWHYSIARMVDACTSAGILPFYGPYGDIRDTLGCETQFRGACEEDGKTYSRGMVQARYDAVADFYISGFDSVADSVSLAFLDLLGSVAGLRVLDVACGHGRITRELARRGADVAGIDISGNLIRKALETEQNEPLGIRYIHADVTTPELLSDREFDMVTCSFGLSDIDDLGPGPRCRP